MATQNISIRLSAEGAEQLKGKLRELGTEGQRALRQIEQSGVPASRGLLALNAVTGELRASFEQYGTRLGPIGSGLSALGPAGLAAAAGIGALTVALVAALRGSREALRFADDLVDVSDKLGIAVGPLQELRFAFEQNGVAAGAVDVALQRFTRRAAEAAQGSGEAKDALKALGVALTDNEGRLRPTEDLLRDVADGLSRVPGQADRVRLAFKLFDSEGVALVNLLQQGAEALDAFRQQARDLGIVMDEDLVRRAAETNDELEVLARIADVQLKSALIDLAPILVAMASALAGAARAIADVVDGFRDLEARSARGLKDELEEVEARLTRLRSVSDETLAMSGGYGFRPVQRADVTAEIARLEERAAALRAEIAQREAAAGGPAAGGLRVTNPDAAKFLNDLQLEVDLLNDLAAAYHGSGRSVEEQTRLNEVMALARQHNIDLGSKERDLLEDLVRDRAAYNKVIQEGTDAERQLARLVEKTATEEERQLRARADLAQLRAYADTPEEIEAVRRALQDLNGETETFGEVTKGAVGNVGSEVSRTLVTLRGGFDELGDVAVSALNRILERMLELAAINPILNAIPGANFNLPTFTWGSTPSPTTPHLVPGKAGGGPVAPGQIYLVNERRIESASTAGLFMPLAPGRIDPSGRGGGVNVNVIDRRSGDAEPVSVRQRRGADGGMDIDVVIAERLTAMGEDGRFDRILSPYGAQRQLVNR